VTAFADRAVPFDTCFNFRDLGGYPTQDGAQVRWKTLFRADTLHRLDGADLDAFHDLGLCTVIDLRSGHEVDDHGQLRPAVDTLVVHHLPMLDEVGGPNRPAPALSPAETATLTAGNAYISMADRGRHAIGRAVTLLARPERLPAVFHCTAGKDRTGILAAVVLGALGVGDDDIVVDYMLTDETRAARDAFLQIHDPDYYAFLQRLPVGFREMDADAIPTMLAWIRSEHGTVTEYLRTGGVDEPTLTALRANLLQR
jgi:protein-tyrosine phosphatase